MIMSKWRNHNIDIQEIEFKSKFTIIKEVSYPHASNELTEVLAKLNGEVGEYIIKVSRREDSDLKKEFEVLSSLNKITIPKVIEYGIHNNKEYLITEKVSGKKMSVIDKENNLTLDYLESFGESLAKIHNTKINQYESPKRRFHDLLVYDEFINHQVNPWLVKNRSNEYHECFCHGDHHYANVLFRDESNYTVLDWELSGLGFKEFDIAWAVVLRPGQTFFKTNLEENAFLKGYMKYGSITLKHYTWFKVLIMSHFYKIGKENNNEQYVSYLLKSINEVVNYKSF